MPAAVITEQDKVRARHHLGYLGVQESATFSLGIPAGVQTQFMIEGALHRLLPMSVPKFLELLERLDCIECEIYDGADTATIDQIGELKINRKRLQELADVYMIARTALANLLGIVPNPYDQRPFLGAAGGINMSVT